MTLRGRVWAAGCCLAIFCSLLAVQAQTATGDLAGRVTDSQGAALVGGEVKAVEIATGHSRNTITNAEGIFSLPLLAPGRYHLTASGPQMTTGVADIELLVGSYRDVNFVLRPASAPTTVQVTGETPAIETTSAEIKSNIDPRQMMNLPLDGRTFASLAILAPGVRPTFGGDSTFLVSINGSTGRNFNLTVDGGENKDHEFSEFLQSYTTEGIQEFVVKTYNFSADTSNSSGAVINIVTRAGTNNFHGGAFFVLRNRNLE